MEPREIGEASSSHYPQVKQISKAEVKKKLLGLSEKQKEDKIDLSSQAKKISEYLEIIKKMPDVREEKIKEVEKGLAAGEYNSKEILEKILEKIIKEIL